MENHTAPASVWDNAPETELIPFLSNEERATLINNRTEIYVTGMEYEANATYGPRFVATFIVPNGDARQYAMKSSGGRSPRDHTNKWMREQLKNGTHSRIPAVLCKMGSAFFLAKPGAESETVGNGGRRPGNSLFDEPDF